MRPHRGWWRPRPAAFLAALLLALLVAGGEGWYYLARETPTPQVLAGVGQVVRVNGAEVQVRSITIAPELPAAEPGEPAVRGPAGSVLVLVTWVHTLVDPAVVVEQHSCSGTLVADDGTVWLNDYSAAAATGELRRPEALVCGDALDFPLVVGVPRTIGTSYLIPASYAASVRWRLSVGDDRHVVEFRP